MLEVARVVSITPVPAAVTPSGGEQWRIAAAGSGSLRSRDTRADSLLLYPKFKAALLRQRQEELYILDSFSFFGRESVKVIQK